MSGRSPLFKSRIIFHAVPMNGLNLRTPQSEEFVLAPPLPYPEAGGLVHRSIKHVDREQTDHSQAACHFANCARNQAQGSACAGFPGLFPVSSTKQLESESAHE